MLKTIAFYAGVSVVFGMLAVGSMKYKHQFSLSTPASSNHVVKSGDAGIMRITNDWGKKTSSR
ncbi:MAG: hypothetical protein OEZ43_01210 [Gammaproteobacteria bacterium]|nr:hypothetical protein [Gammaproteobacteria bacterium]